MFYMALLMGTPMGILMLQMMPMMYPNKQLNLRLYALFALLFVVAFWSMRAQGLVGDRQFVRAMIPHHSGAILMCNRASLENPKIRDLCFGPDGIVESQRREIELMKAFLAGQVQAKARLRRVHLNRGDGHNPTVDRRDDPTIRPHGAVPNPRDPVFTSLRTLARSATQR